ncbi:unnamed protein product [Prorocentrum cordatum]|uniref:Transmembrane protein n=1 Tax=Prorocentrum cordatum TaxID=2364126 RepID=A0ABN9WDP9_9DINO|nr:unnamed protein product [Polarella glacialis]
MEGAALSQEEGPARPSPAETALLQQQNAELVGELAEAQATSAVLLREDTELQRINLELQRLLNVTKNTTNSGTANATYSGYHEIELSGAKRSILKPVAICVTVVVATAVLCCCSARVLRYRHRLAQRDRIRQSQARGGVAGDNGGVVGAISQAVDTGYAECSACCGVVCSVRVCVMASFIGVLWGAGLLAMWATGGLQPVLKEVAVYAYLALGIGSLTTVCLLGVVLNAREELHDVGHNIHQKLDVGRSIENVGSSVLGTGQRSPTGPKR